MATDTPVESLRRHARAAGLLYLIIIVSAGFAEGYVRSSLIVPGDAGATAGNIMAAEWLFRLGLAGDLVAFLSDAAVAVLLYVLLRPVSRTLSLVAAAFRLVAHPAIGALNLVNHYAALVLLGGADWLAVFAPEQLHALVMVFLDAHGTGYLIAGAFFGVHLVLLGYLLYRSAHFPAFLGVLVAVAGAAYLAESFGSVLAPGAEALLAWLVGLSAAVAELWLCLYLLVKGVREPAEEPAA